MQQTESDKISAYVWSCKETIPSVGKFCYVNTTNENERNNPTPSRADLGLLGWKYEYMYYVPIVPAKYVCIIYIKNKLGNTPKDEILW